MTSGQLKSHITAAVATLFSPSDVKGKKSPVLGSQPAGDASHKPGGRLPLLSARPAVTPATLKRAATNFAAW